MTEFPENLPVWDLITDGLVIADFAVNNVKGIVFTIQNGVIHTAYARQGIFNVWDYESKRFKYISVSGQNFVQQFKEICNSQLEGSTAVVVGELNEDDINYRAIPAE